MRNFYVCFAILAGLTWEIHEVHAGAWTQKRGRGYYKLEARFIHASQYFEPDGSIINIPTLKDFTFSFYGEHGLSDRLTAVAYVPFYQHLALNQQEGIESGFVYVPGDSASGFADSDVGLRFGLLQNSPTVLSAKLMFGLPIGEDQQQSGLITGDGEFNQILTLELGRSFYPLPLYFTVEAGFNNRTKGYSDEFRYAAEVGYTFRERILLIMKMNGIASLKNGDGQPKGGIGGLYGDEVSYLALGPSVGYLFSENIGIVAQVDGATYGQNVLASPAFALGVFWKK